MYCIQRVLILYVLIRSILINSMTIRSLIHMHRIVVLGQGWTTVRKESRIKVCKIFSQSRCRQLLYIFRPLTSGTIRNRTRNTLNYNTVF